jgi:hypothetical protein
VRQSVEGGEERDRLVEAAVEGRAVGLPARANEPIPERLGVGGIVEQPAVAEVPELAAARRLGRRLVQEDPLGERPDVLGFDHGRSLAAPAGRQRRNGR